MRQEYTIKCANVKAEGERAALRRAGSGKLRRKTPPKIFNGKSEDKTAKKFSNKKNI